MSAAIQANWTCQYSTTRDITRQASHLILFRNGTFSPRLPVEGWVAEDEGRRGEEEGGREGGGGREEGRKGRGRRGREGGGERGREGGGRVRGANDNIPAAGTRNDITHDSVLANRIILQF